MTLREEILSLKNERKAILLAHNYCPDDVQEIADFTGDSLQLSIQAAKTKAPVIVFCGVRFMAETAKILSPDSIVLHPVPDAGCPMAEMANAERIRAFRQSHPDHMLVAYVNTTAETKAEVDICCTSANAERIVASIPADRPILFLPDRNLGANISKKLNRPMELWPGFCPIHDRITIEDVKAAKAAHPHARFLCHPECRPDVVALADEALSTGGMIARICNAEESEFIIGTESGILHRLSIDAAGKKLYPLAPPPVCPDMKKLSLEAIRDALRSNTPEIKLSADIIEKARKPIERMLAL